MYANGSNRKSPETEVKKVFAANKGEEHPTEIVEFQLEKRLVGILEHGTATLREDIIATAARLRNCQIVNLDVREGHSKVTVNITISAQCKTALTGALSDYRKNLKFQYRQMDTDVETFLHTMAQYV